MSSCSTWSAAYLPAATPGPIPTSRSSSAAPPAAIDTLVELGTTCVTLSNNHALDYGAEALLDTFDHLEAAGITWVGAGTDLERARAPAVLEIHGHRIAVVGVTDHPPAFAAGRDRPGVAYADLRAGIPAWLTRSAAPGPATAPEAPDAVIVMPHWGPNMTSRPVAYVRARPMPWWRPVPPWWRAIRRTCSTG